MDGFINFKNILMAVILVPLSPIICGYFGVQWMKQVKEPEVDNQTKLNN